MTKKTTNPDPEEDRGSMNDQVKLHNDKFFSGALSEVSQRRRSQTAQRPPNPSGLMRWKSVRKEKPRYYVNVNIWDGKEVFYNWARVSDGDHDYYVNNVTNEIKTDVKYWSYPFGEDYPKYEPMTAKDLKK